jgi:hypothetical protein
LEGHTRRITGGAQRLDIRGFERKVTENKKAFAVRGSAKAGSI